MSKTVSGLLLVAGMLLAIGSGLLVEDSETIEDKVTIALAIIGIAMFFFGAMRFSRGR